MQNLAPVKLQSFQQQYALYLRDPKRLDRPQGVPARESKIYEELLFNNICGFIDACFPVAKSLFTDKRWLTLCRGFFRDWSSHTPYFSKIPEQFVKYIQAKHKALRVPAYLPDLLHYEWLELEVETSIDNNSGATSSRRLMLNPSVRYARYQWPVHQISKTFKPRKTVPTVLLVHRDSQDAVKFLEINEMTAQLLDILAAGAKTANEAIKHLAKGLGYASPDPLLIHGHALLADLLKQEILQGNLS
jgi:hypothetical protein